MIPQTINTDNLVSSEEYESPPSKTYRLDFENKRIIGKVDGADALLQFIRKTLSTDKYAYPIYDWYYGNELLNLVGKPYAYVETECPRIIREALLVDGRILSVDNFKFSNMSTDSLTVSCTVRTVFGIINYYQEVSV